MCLQFRLHGREPSSKLHGVIHCPAGMTGAKTVLASVAKSKAVKLLVAVRDDFGFDSSRASVEMHPIPIPPDVRVVPDGSKPLLVALGGPRQLPTSPTKLTLGNAAVGD